MARGRRPACNQDGGLGVSLGGQGSMQDSQGVTRGLATSDSPLAALNAVYWNTAACGRDRLAKPQTLMTRPSTGSRVSPRLHPHRTRCPCTTRLLPRHPLCPQGSGSSPPPHTQPLGFQRDVWGCAPGTWKAGAGRGPLAIPSIGVTVGDADHQRGGYLAKVTEGGVGAVPSWERAVCHLPVRPSSPSQAHPTSTPADFPFQVSPGILPHTRHSPTVLGTR